LFRPITSSISRLPQKKPRKLHGFFIRQAQRLINPDQEAAETFLAGFSAACFFTAFLAGLLTASGAEAAGAAAGLAAFGASGADAAANATPAPNKPAATHRAVNTDFMVVP
jgi:hypothetical protein